MEITAKAVFLLDVKHLKTSLDPTPILCYNTIMKGVGNMRTIWYDMDGTIADLYGVENWLDYLQASDPYPYMAAGVMHNMSILARYLNKLQTLGYQIGIITWLAKDATESYDEAVKSAKAEWLQLHLHSVTFNEVYMVSYGIPKTTFMNTDSDILFDDNEEIRNEWTGESHEPFEIFSILKKLLQQE